MCSSIASYLVQSVISDLVLEQIDRVPPMITRRVAESIFDISTAGLLTLPRTYFQVYFASMTVTRTLTLCLVILLVAGWSKIHSYIT